MKSVSGDDELGEAATVLFQSVTTKGTDQNYTSSLKTFFEFCDTSLIDPKQSSPIDIARFIAWLGKRGQWLLLACSPTCAP